MTGHEQVVLALARVREAHQPALGADRVEPVVAARDELLRINLMPGVPDEPVLVLREVERQVQRQAQFDDAEVTREVRRSCGQDANQLVADFVRQRLQLFVRERLQVARGFDLWQQFGGH